MRGFLGLTSYYRLFIKGYRSIVAPLNFMLKKGAFQWDEAAKKSFEDLKQALLSPPVLRMANFVEEFILECDTSGVGIGTVLMQQGNPIAFFQSGIEGEILISICI